MLKDDPQQIAWFQENVTLDTHKTMQSIVSEFDEQRSGIISFGILSKTWKQCNSYPLALVDENNRVSQPLFQANNQPFNPSVKLCGSERTQIYFDVKTFKTGSYPLGYPLQIVYPKDNRVSAPGSKFAELVTTREGQCLLKKAGLVPLQAIPENDRTSHACKSLP